MVRTSECKCQSRKSPGFDPQSSEGSRGPPELVQHIVYRRRGNFHLQIISTCLPLRKGIGGMEVGILWFDIPCSILRHSEICEAADDTVLNKVRYSNKNLPMLKFNSAKLDEITFQRLSIQYFCHKMLLRLELSLEN